MTYQAIIAKIYTRETPNAQNLLLGDVLGYQVLVGKETPDGALGAYFPTDGQLSQTFCDAHNLVGYKDPVTGEKRGGYFDKNRRVKTLKLRKEKSDGFWMPISCLAFTGIDLSTLAEGYKFTEINGIEICRKYVTEATRLAIGRQQAKTKKTNPMFKEHVDTEQFAYNKEFIKASSLITLTAKAHGTSHRMGNVIEYVPGTELVYVEHPENKLVSFFKRIFNLPPKFTWEEIDGLVPTWKEVHGTRRVQLADIHGAGDGYYGDNFRDKATEKLQGRLKQGETLYFEIVGWANDKPIMEPHRLNKKDHPDLFGKYPDVMYYSYGCLPGQNRILVYRITQTNENGQSVELSWNQVKRRCAELGVDHVFEYSQFIYGHSDNAKTLEELEFIVEQLAESQPFPPDPLDSRHIREGVVIRVDAPDGTTQFYKHKGFWFKLLEGIIKNDETVVDVEESS